MDLGGCEWQTAKFNSQPDSLAARFIAVIIMNMDENSECYLEDVLVFFCGAAHVPPIGFEKQPTLSFS